MDQDEILTEAPERATPLRDDVPPPPLPASSLPDKAVARPSTAVSLDNFRVHQELLKQVASNLGLKVEGQREPTDDLFGVLAAAAPSRVALPVHEGVVKLAKTL